MKAARGCALAAFAKHSLGGKLHSATPQALISGAGLRQMLDTPYKSKLMQMISQSFLSYAKCLGRPPLGREISAPHFSRYLISFSCRLLKNMSQNQSFVSNCFGASDSSRIASLTSSGTSAGRLTRVAFPRDLILFSCRLPKMEALNHSVVCSRFGASECADIVPVRGGGFRGAPTWWASRHQPCRRHESAAMRLPPASLTSPGTSAGRLTRDAYPRDRILFSCRLPKMEALNHSVVCTRFGASDSSRTASLTLSLAKHCVASRRDHPRWRRGGGFRGAYHPRMGIHLVGQPP
jgi:hypothetical protein